MTISSFPSYILPDVHYLPPLNIILALYIMIQNAMIIYHYHKDWRRISSMLFILIAATDIGRACTEMAWSPVMLICLTKPFMELSPRVFLPIIMLNLSCCITSTFIGVVLTVVKTINIANPFYQINNRALKIILIIFPLMILALCISDICLWLQMYDRYYIKTIMCGFDPYGPWSMYMNLDVIGHRTLSRVILYTPISIDSIHLSVFITDVFLLVLEYCLPCIVVFICMVLQMFHIRSAFGHNENPQLNDSNRIIVTIFLISLLYLGSVSFYAFSFLSVVVDNFVEIKNTSATFSTLGREVIIGKSVLPLLNAALFPTILILRKPDLRAKYMHYIIQVARLPLTVYRAVRDEVLRRRGYTTIPSSIA